MRMPLAIAALCLSAFAARGEDQAGVKWDQLRPDNRVSAQMLCGLSMLMFVQEVVGQCHLHSLSIDDARERAIHRIEDFVSANSSQRPSMSVFVEMRRAIGENFRKSTDHRVCSDPSFDKWWRGGTPAELDASVEKMLTTTFDPNRRIPCGR
ncbi:MAG: hypothetical protein KGM15_16545 [Pseudomonadota bacterium]|nr:hypothetical protein [Pseudomonadota bacterium]